MAEPVTHLPAQRDPLPQFIDLDPNEGMPPHTAKEMSLLQQELGCRIDEVTDGGDMERMLVWFKLRRMGYQPTWDEAGDVLIRHVMPTPPTGGG